MEILVIIGIGTVALYWRAAGFAKEAAVEAARRACTYHDVQLLDQTVILTRLSASRNENDRWRMWREYRFEYAVQGEDRVKGKLVLLGQSVSQLELETFGPTVH